MEKVTYLIEHELSEDKFYDFCVNDLLPPLQTLNANNVCFAICDDAVEAAKEKRYLTTAPSYNIFLTFFLPTALQLDGDLAGDAAIEFANVLSHSIRCDRYVVTESMVLDPSKNSSETTKIKRLSGWMQLALLTQPEKLSREAWLETWLYSHTKIAVETQSTFGYTQNLVQRSLPDTQLAIDGVVTEHFPNEAMTSLDVFYDADNNEAKRQQKEQAMMESCARFIDFSSINVIPMSAYVVHDNNTH